MKEPALNKNRKLNSWLISLAINLAILIAVFALTEVAYETNDDYAIARELTAGYPYVGFVSYYLCKAIIAVQNIFPQHNMFVISQIAMSFAALTVLLKTFISRRESAAEIIPAAMICLLFSFDHYGCVQFTKTSALLMTAGLIWAVDNYCNERKIIPFIPAFLLYYTGVAFRQKGMFPALAYAGGFMLIWWIQNRKEVFVKGRTFRELGVIFLILVILVVPYGLDKMSDRMNESTPELKLAREYQAERRQITDYHAMKHYDEHREEYEEAGLTENDVYMVDRWIFDYDGSASLENLKTINRINKPNTVSTMTVIKAVKKAVRNSLSSVKDLNFTGMHIVIVLLLALYLLFMNKPQALTYVIMIGALTVIIYAAIYYMQRPQYRALYLADESAAFWIMYAAMLCERRKLPKLRFVYAVIIAAAVLCMMSPAVKRVNALDEYNKSQIMSEKVTGYFADNPEYFFIGPTTSMGMSPAYGTPLGRAETIANMSDTGGWDTMTPYKLEFLRNGGIENPVKDLINNPHALFFGDGKRAMLTEYYNKWYCEKGETVRFEKVDEVAGNGIYKVVRE